MTAHPIMTGIGALIGSVVMIRFAGARLAAGQAAKGSAAVSKPFSVSRLIGAPIAATLSGISRIATRGVGVNAATRVGTFFRTVRSGGGVKAGVMHGSRGMSVGRPLGASIDDIAANADEILTFINAPAASVLKGRSLARAQAVQQLVLEGGQAGKALVPLITSRTSGPALRAAVTSAQTNMLTARAVWWPGFGNTPSWGKLLSSPNPLKHIGAITVGNVLIKAPSAVLRMAIPMAIGAAGLDILLGFMKSGYGSLVGSYKKDMARVRARLKLSPADDNLFPPNPASYMTLGFWQRKGVWEKTTLWTRQFAAGIAATFTGTTITTIRDWWKKAFEMPDPHMLEKRVRPTACRYKLVNQTIFDTFEEMSLRHPGWIYGARPYGNEFRYTMFFGLPSQRYWSKPGSRDFITRINKLHSYIVSMIEQDEIDVSVMEAQLKEAYGSEESERMSDEAWAALADIGLRESQTGPNAPTPPVLVRGGTEHKNMLKQAALTKLIPEYLSGMEQRFVPFRRYHILSSDQDIVSNGIVSSETSVVNNVLVSYLKMDSETGSVTNTVQSLDMQASSSIPDYMLNMATVQYPNCTGYGMAVRYGQGSLMTGLKSMYKGEIMILGNARIRPWDVCILMDDYNDMAGPVEVESVIHMFSHETGFLTEIKPNALVYANEISSWPVLEGVKLFAMAYQSLNSDSKTIASRLDNDIGATRLVGGSSAVVDRFTDENMSADDIRNIEHFRERYAATFGTDNPIDEFRNVLRESDLGQATGIDMIAPRFGTTTTSGLAAVFGSAALVFGGARTLSPWLSGGKRLMGFLGGAAGAGAGGTIVWNNRKHLANSAAWMVGMNLLFSKAMEEETVNVIPLLKNGKPIVAGLTLKSPAEMFSSILGAVTNSAEDTINGITTLNEEYSRYREHSWAAFDELHQGRSGFIDKMAHRVSFFNDWKATLPDGPR
jgi:hypothetical protein